MLVLQDKYNIKVNCVVPVAGSRMTETVLPADMLKLLDPQHITPLVAYLAHESAQHTGACFEAGGGWYSQVHPVFFSLPSPSYTPPAVQVRFQRSEGLSLAGQNGAIASAEELQRHIGEITDFGRENTYPTSPASALREMIAAQG